MVDVPVPCYKNCPRCLGTGKQEARKARIGGISGTKMPELKPGKCTFCEGAGKIKIG